MFAKEEIIAKEIEAKKESGERAKFVIKKGLIRTIKRGDQGYGFTMRFIAWPDDADQDHKDELLIVEAIKEGNNYFLKPIFSDDKILMAVEDWAYSSTEEEVPISGAIKISNERYIDSTFDSMMRADFYYKYESTEPNYCRDHKELVIENPLAIALRDLHSIDEFSEEEIEAIRLSNEKNKQK